MSLPNVPNINPEITLKRDEAINLLLTSIAMEEIGVSHILNAEGEKIQYTLSQNPSLDELKGLNKGTERLLQNLIKKEILQQFKLENILDMDQERHSLDEDCDYPGE